jgi:hypothetical protein
MRKLLLERIHSQTKSSKSNPRVIPINKNFFQFSSSIFYLCELWSFYLVYPIFFKLLIMWIWILLNRQKPRTLLGSRGSKLIHNVLIWKIMSSDFIGRRTQPVAGDSFMARRRFFYLIREKNLLWVVNLSSATNWILRPIKPANMIFHISTLWINFDPLNPSNIRGFQRFIWTHKHIINTLKKLGMKKNVTSQNLINRGMLIKRILLELN